jgi:hypothetical protein
MYISNSVTMPILLSAQQFYVENQEPTEVGTSAFKGPGQITVGLSIGVHDGSTSQDDLEVLYIICCRAILARAMKEAASEDQPAHADLGICPSITLSS